VRRPPPPPPPAPAESPLFLATTLAGLEDVLADEARAKLPHVRLLEQGRGRLILEAPAAAPLYDLRTADNLYRVLSRFRAGPHRADLDGVFDVAAGIDLRPFATGGPAAPGAAGPPTLFVNASRAGQHTYSRFELAAAATAGLLAGHPGWREGEATAHDLELRLDASDERAVLSLRLTPATFRFRGARAFSPAALRPTVAHALVWLSRPAPADRFLDPFCGSGTILSERLPYPAARLLGGDREAEAIRAARANLPAGRRLRVARWDARRLPLRAGTIDAVVSNLPFGRQVLAAGEIGVLYRDFAAELARVLAPGGRAVLLTDQAPALLAALAAAGLRGAAQLTLSLKGLHPQVVAAGPA
jgi:23S rRNA G2445 N2-methylase RlmL